MFHNYFFLKRLAAELDQMLLNKQLVACFSQNKNELILGFGKGNSETYLIANLDPNVSLLSISENFYRAGKNSIDLFPTLLGSKVAGVTAFDYERSFQMLFENDSLIFKMHARRANILYAKNDSVIEIFRKNLAPDMDIHPSGLHQQVQISEAHFAASGYDPLTFLPALGREADAFLKNQGFYHCTPQEKWNMLQSLLHTLENNPIYLHDTSAVSLLKPTALTTNYAVKAANWLYEKTVHTFYFKREKDKIAQKLKQQIKRSENYISKTKTKLHQVQNSRSPEEVANIIMANLNSLQTGLSRAVLHDFYLNQPIEIKLNRTLSPQKNAENLYRKSKNRHREIDNLRTNIQEKEQLIDQLSRQILDMEAIDNNKDFRKFLKDHKLINSKQVKEKNKSYHEFEIDDWTILLGKNAKANDELTLKVANKNDLWLHAKDVSGSHVVVRQKPGQNFPSYIIEKAASLAAAHSKRKTDSLCPVIYTQKKFVRKVKGAPAGQVLVEKEEVVMVAPSSIPPA